MFIAILEKVQGKVDNSLLCVKKFTNSHDFFFNVLKQKKLFCTIMNLMIIFHFIFKMLKYPILKVKFLKMFLLAQDVRSYKMNYM